nr:MAG TPA: hypothetical protein [Caudoviricetes sp.]
MVSDCMIPPSRMVVKNFSTMQGNLFLDFIFTM